MSLPCAWHIFKMKTKWLNKQEDDIGYPERYTVLDSDITFLTVCRRWGDMEGLRSLTGLGLIPDPTLFKISGKFLNFSEPVSSSVE